MINTDGINKNLQSFIKDRSDYIEENLRRGINGIFDMPDRKSLNLRDNIELDAFLTYMIMQSITFYTIVNLERIVGITSIEKDLISIATRAIRSVIELNTKAQGTIQ